MCMCDCKAAESCANGSCERYPILCPTSTERERKEGEEGQTASLTCSGKHVKLHLAS